MKHILIGILAMVAAPAVWADWGVNVNIGVGSPYYGYAPADVVYVQRYVPEYDVPRVFVVARRARVAPAVVVDYYRRGYGWGPTCSHFGVSAAVVYGSAYPPAPVYAPAPVYVAPPPVYYYREGPPYGNAYGHYKYKGYKHHGGKGRDRD